MNDKNRWDFESFYWVVHSSQAHVVKANQNLAFTIDIWNAFSHYGIYSHTPLKQQQQQQQQQQQKHAYKK